MRNDMEDKTEGGGLTDEGGDAKVPKLDHEGIKADLLTYLGDLRKEMELIKSNILVLRAQHSSIESQAGDEDKIADFIERDEKQLDDVIDRINKVTVYAPATDKQPDPGNFFRALPDELIIQIIKWLPDSYLYQLHDVSKRWRALMLSTTMLNHEKKVRWRSRGSVKLLKNDTVAESRNHLFNMRQYDGKIYYLQCPRRLTSNRCSIHCGGAVYDISHDGHIVNGCYTVHDSVVYYAVQKSPRTDLANIIYSFLPGDKNKQKTCVISEGINSMVVAGDYLYVATNGMKVHILNKSLEKILVHEIDTLLTSFVVFGKKAILYGSADQQSSYEFEDETMKKNVSSSITTIGDIPCRLMAMACSENAIYSYFETDVDNVDGEDARYYGMFRRKDESGAQDSLPFRMYCEDDSEERRRPGERSMGITGYYVYISTSYEDCVLMDTRTMLVTLFTMPAIVRDVVLAPDNSLYILGLFVDYGDDKIIRFHWDVPQKQLGSSQKKRS